MKRLNEKILEDSFGMKPHSIYDLTIRLNKKEMNCLTSLIKHYYYDESDHYYETGQDKDHIYLYWLKFLDGLPQEYINRELMGWILQKEVVIGKGDD
jgi:hypothetical protein